MQEEEEQDAYGHALERRLMTHLAARRREGSLRVLSVPPEDMTDFASNDYLGLARSLTLRTSIDRTLQAQASSDSIRRNGATGSRLLSGNSALAERLEQRLATFYGSEAALVFNSGYAANLGVLGSLPAKEDVVLVDELAHNSCREGLRLSRAAQIPSNIVTFRHNDLADVERLLLDHQPTPQEATKRCMFIVVEGIYSMDGDQAPLQALVELAERYDAYLIVDEAHSVGVLGPQGSGLVRELSLEHTRVLCCRVYTFGKAMGCHGAVVCGSRTLIQYLINYARSFVFSTAPPMDQLVAIQCAHEACASADQVRSHLRTLIQAFRQRIQASSVIPAEALLPSSSPVQVILVPGNRNVVRTARAIAARGILVLPIRAPTVPKHQERLRVSLHAFNTLDEIAALADALEASITLPRTIRARL